MMLSLLGMALVAGCLLWSRRFGWQFGIHAPLIEDEHR